MTQAEQAPAVDGADSGRTKIWAHSGDSHLMEPEDLGTSRPALSSVPTVVDLSVDAKIRSACRSILWRIRE
jgi:hypothetical protein